MFRIFRWLPTVLTAAALLTLGQTGTLLAQPPAQKPDASRVRFRPDSLLVKPQAGAPAGALNSLHSANGVTVAHTFARFGNLQVLRLPANLPVERALAIYRQNPLVEYAEPDYIYSTTQVQTIPNDTSFANLWGMHNTGQTGGTADADIDAPEAWSLRTDASSVIVGVIDTGIDYTHPDLAANVWVNSGEIPNNGIDDDGNGYIDDVYGINSITNSGNPMDDQATTYHGTHVSGTIGAAGNNGLGVAGVAWNVKLMGLKFLDSTGSGSSSNAIKCIDYAISKGASILSNSWGGGGYSQALYDAINRARAAGIIFVAAAGNSALDTDTNIFYPAGYRLSNVIAVASTDSRDARSSFSNYGYSTVHLGAPGSSIYSTMAGGSYQSLSGTSMATPHVSGALALIKAHFPAYSMSELITRLLTSTDAISSMSSTTISGGRLNIYKALAGIERPIAQVTASPKGGEPGVTVTFTDGSIGNISSRTLDFGDGSTPVNFSGSTTHTYPNLGTYTVTLTVSGPSGTATRTQVIAVTRNYDVAADTYNWVDTTGMASVSLTDDSVSGAIALPFSFPFYGSNYSSLYIGSNGLITFGSNSGATAYSNDAIPSSAAPNAAIYAFWDDLDPGAVTTDFIRYGSTPDGNFVVSWEGVPAYGNPTLPLTFQAILTPAGVVRLQYQEVQAANTSFGAGRSATVGVEHPAGLVARRYSYNGSPLLANNTAIRFTWPTGAAPAAPSNLTATAVSGTQINLAWTDNSADETGFYVERATDGVSFTQIAQLGAGVTAYQNTGLSSGITYTYRVRSFNGSGNSGYSNTAATAVLAVPAAPSGLTATAVSGTQINLGWADNSNNENGFYVERATDGATFTQIAQLGAGVTAYQNTGLSSGITYTYRVRAFNDGGNSGYSNTAAASVLTAPAAPSGLTATVISGTQVNLAWTDNSNNETGFTVEVSSDNASFSPLVQLGAGLTSYAHTGLTAGVTLYYRVYASNTIGNSNYSNTASATPPLAPLAPASASATAVSATQINLAWTDSSNNETGFRVYRSTDNVTFTQIVQLGAGVTAYQSTGLTANTTYYYRVTAYNLGGESAPASASTTTADAAPAAPSGLTATALSTTSIRLSWSDNSSNESGFVIERLSGKVWAALTTVGSNTTTWTDTGLSLGTKYTYRVKARNIVGDSAYSNTANATTPRR